MAGQNPYNRLEVDALPAALERYVLGGGSVEAPADELRLTIPAMGSGYADAQVDDTQRRRRSGFRWSAPARFQLEARASCSQPRGTLGFGFWNDPFAVSLGQGGAARRLPTAPQALWFFYGSPPNDLAFQAGAAGHGWKAVSLRSPALPGPLLIPTAAGAFALSRLPGLARPIVALARGVVSAAEASLPAALDEWHRYELDWRPCEAVFRVDGAVVLVADRPPGGRLGFVAWIDNQYASLSPRTGLRFGRLDTLQPQSLEIRHLRLQEL